MSREKPKDKYCDFNSFKRARYFHGMLMGERDFEEEQKYHIKKRKLLNRMLHGCGVVCGLEITPANSNCPGPEITIKPGLALDCHGSEIFVCEPYQLNVEECINASKPSLREVSDQEKCDEMDKTTAGDTKWYVIIKYKEVPITPVPVYAPGGGCEEKVCEHSRIREGFCIELKTDIELYEHCKPPQLRIEESKGSVRRVINREELCEKLLMPCPGDCCDDPCVVLGSITLPRNRILKEGITDKEINNWDLRRYVMTFGLLEHWMIQLGYCDLGKMIEMTYACARKKGGAPESFLKEKKSIFEDEKTETKKKSAPPKEKTTETKKPEAKKK